jgi:hypothetical protein
VAERANSQCLCPNTSSSTCQESKEKKAKIISLDHRCAGWSIPREIAWYHVPCCRCHYLLLRFIDLVSPAFVPCYGPELSSVLSGLNRYPLPPPVAIPTLYRHSKLIFKLINYRVTLIQSLCLDSENNCTQKLMTVTNETILNRLFMVISPFYEPL